MEFCTKCKKLHRSPEDTGPTDETGTARTARLLAQVMNSLERDLRFTTETAEDFPSGTLPTLDYQVWKEVTLVHAQEEENTETQVPREITQFRYKYFEKPMSTKYFILETSASSWEQKKASLA